MIELTKEKSRQLKGIAVLMMILHHLWGFPNRVLPFTLEESQVTIGEFSKICVAIFLFLSGYGLLKSHSNSIHSIFTRIKKIYIQSWKVMFFLIILMYSTHTDTYKNFPDFLGNILLFKYNHCNAEWWFIGTYIELILFLPILFKVKNIYLWIASCILFRYLSTIIDPSSVLEKHLFAFLYYYPIFILGCIFARYNLFEKATTHIRKKIILIILIIMILGLITLRVVTSWSIVTFFIVPLFIAGTIIIKQPPILIKTLDILGIHSMNIWLIHSLFCYYIFKDFLYTISIGNSYFAFPILVLISLISSLVINMFWERTFHLFRPKHTNEKGPL